MTLRQLETQPGTLQGCLHWKIVQDLNTGAGTVEIPSVLGAAKIWDRSTVGACPTVAGCDTAAAVATVAG
jgi:hypothetical protein